MKTFGFVLTASALMFAGCASRPVPRPADTAPDAAATAPAPKIPVIKDLAGTNWTVAELDGESAAPAVAGWPAQSLEFGAAGLQFTGHGGVNRFGGRYAQYDGELTFGPLAMTRRAGPSELMAAEHRYTQVLSRVVGWRQDGERIVLLTPGSKRAAVLERVKPAAGAPW